MGYYSDVKYVIKFPSRQVAREFIAVRRIDPELCRAIDALKYLDGDRPMLVGDFGWCKWYPEFEEVKCHHRLMSEAEDMGIGIAFVRIGEEHDDNETSYATGDHEEYGDNMLMYDELQLHRSIDGPDTTYAVAPRSIFEEN